MKVKQLSISLTLGLGLTLALLWLLGRLSVAYADPSTRYVATTGNDTDNNCTNSGNPCRTVQYAVDQAAKDDKILVATGTYTGVAPREGVSQVVYISQTVTIRGGYNTNFSARDPNTYPTTLNAEEDGRVIYITGDISPTIEGLRITGGDAKGLGGGPAGDSGGGVYVITATATISNNQVFSNIAYDGGGLQLIASNTKLISNTIRDNEAKRAGGGLFVYLGTPELSGNTIRDNEAGQGGGLFMYLSDPALSFNDIISNTAEKGGGLRLAYYSTPTLSFNDIISNIADYGGGLYLRNHISAMLSFNDIISNTADYGGGLYLEEHSTATLSFNDITANTADRGGGLDAYISTVTLRDNNVISNTAHYAGGGLRLSHYSSATLSFNDIAFNTAITGGGLYLEEYSTATLSDNIICSNTASFGGGLALHRHSEATLSDSTVISNTAHNGYGGGLSLTNYSTARLSDDTIISNNTAKEGGGLYLNLHSNATLSQNTVVSSNTAHKFGGGLRLAYSSTATLSDTHTISNAAQKGGGLYLRNFCAVTSTNTIIADNRLSMITGTGAGLQIEGSSSHLLHTTIARNSGGDGSGVYVTEFTDPQKGIEGYSTVALTNTILVGHEVGITVTSDNTVTVNGVLWYKTPTTVSQAATAIVTVENQLEGDPAFAPDGYHLTTGSKAIDWDEEDGVTTDIDEEDGVTTDIDGDDRPFDGDRDGVAKVDIGADELVPHLEVTKQASPDPVQAGQPLTYTLRVTNTGHVPLTATVTDTLPAHVAPTGTLTWTPVTIPPGKVWTHTVPVTVDMDYGGPLTNMIEVTTDEGATGIHTETSRSLRPAIEVIKEASVSMAKVGDIITYTYTVTNTGDVSLNVSASDNRLTDFSLSTTLEPGDIATGTATYTVQWRDLCPPGRQLVNTVTVTGTLADDVVVTDTDDASVKLSLCPNLPVFGMLLLALLSVVLRRKE